MHDYKLHEIDKTLLSQFLYQCQKAKQVSNARLNRMMAAVKGATSRAVEFGYLTENKLSGYTAMKEPPAKIRYLSDAETARLFEALPNAAPLIRNIVWVAYYTGMRRGEIFTLKWKDINFQTNKIVLDKANTKSSKARYIPIHQNLLPILHSIERTKGKELIFYSPVTGKKLDTIKRSWATLIKTAAIE